MPQIQRSLRSIGEDMAEEELQKSTRDVVTARKKLLGTACVFTQVAGRLEDEAWMNDCSLPFGFDEIIYVDMHFVHNYLPSVSESTIRYVINSLVCMQEDNREFLHRSSPRVCIAFAIPPGYSRLSQMRR
jgi:hypothetical protein